LLHRRQAHHVFRIEMIVMVVRDQHDVDARQLGISIGSATTRFGPAKGRRRPFGEDRIEQDALATEANEIVACPIHVTDGLASGEANASDRFSPRQIPALGGGFGNPSRQRSNCQPESFRARQRIVVAIAIGPCGAGWAKATRRCGSTKATAAKLLRIGGIIPPNRASPASEASWWFGVSRPLGTPPASCPS